MDPNVYLVLAAILVIVGLIGTVVPVLPGALFVFGGLFLAAWAGSFTRVGAVGLTIIGVLAALAFLADFVASLLGAKRSGRAPWRSPARLWAPSSGSSSDFRASRSGPSSAPWRASSSRAGISRRRARSASARGSASSPPRSRKSYSPS